MILFASFALICVCPESAAVETIPEVDCLEKWGQLQKFIIQRRKNGAVENVIVDATTDPTLLATWTDLKAAVDSTKVQVSPYFVSGTLTPGEAIEEGGGNDSIGGIAEITGTDPTPFTGTFKNIKQSIIKAIKKYMCEKELAIFFINEAGQIIGRTSDPATNLDFKGFPVRSFFTSDLGGTGFGASNMNTFKWQFTEGWSDNARIVTPAFDALALLS